MVWSKDRCTTLARMSVGALAAAAVTLAVGLAPSEGLAQQSAAPKTAQPKAAQPATPKAPAPAGAPAAGTPPAAGGQAAAPGTPPEDNAWVKLCEKSAQTENKEICLTHHERLDGNSGIVLVAAAIRKVEGEPKEQILVRLPTAIALAIPAGVQIRIDEEQPLSLKYTLCYATSCQAETDVTPELLASIRKGKQMVVAAVNLQRKAIGFPVPLAGFSKAYEGPPVDNVKYQQARQQLMEMIRKRQQELASKAAEADAKKGQAQAQGAAPAPAPGASTLKPPPTAP
jgi:invasion protein IalB